LLDESKSAVVSGRRIDRSGAFPYVLGPA